jgi:hypothetical protein
VITRATLARAWFVSCVVVAGLFLAVAFGATRVDRWLDGRFAGAA